MSDSNKDLPQEMFDHYAEGREKSRLSQGAGALEKERTLDILSRYLPSRPAVVADVGGGPGEYAEWLLESGYHVHLIDPVPTHVEQARERMEDITLPATYSVVEGDARKLPWENESVDAVLLMGPLYHLTEEEDRIQVFKEAFRVLKSGGKVFAVGISRFASTMDGWASKNLDDPKFYQLVRRDLEDGQHRNPQNNPEYFTTAYFHHPEELPRELLDGGFHFKKLIAIEGPIWVSNNLNHFWEDSLRRAQLMGLLRTIEEERTLIGASAHFMAIGQKP